MYSEGHHKITIYGDAFNGAEQWSLGFRMQNPGGSVGSTDALNTAAQTRANLLDPIVTAWWTSNVGWQQFVSTHRLKGIKVAVIQPDGSYPPGHVPGEVFKANVPGAYVVPAASSYIPQGSVCVTLGTAVPRGLASKGRLFLPPTDYAIGTDGLLLAAARDGLLTKMKNFLTAVNNMEVGNADIAIFSKGPGVKVDVPTKKRWEWTYPTVGTVRPVTNVQIGRVVDTQRRRRRQLVESRTTQVLG